ncbi:MAG: calcium/sodium antiporter [Candidatus Kapaibacteriales bacterium]
MFPTDNIFFQLSTFFVGFFLLIKGADWLVEGSASIAKKFNVSDLFIGLTVVSFGTSAPELLVSVTASIGGNSEVAIGNIFGSNIANIFLILGATSFVKDLKVQKQTVISEVPFTLSAALLIGFLANVTWEPGMGEIGTGLSISRFDGFVILMFFVLFLLYVFNLSKDKPELEENIERLPTRKAVFFLILGVTGLFIGGDWVVDGAVFIADKAGLGADLIGLTIVAFGTSLPELVTTITAAQKGSADMAIGNVVGSNIFNLLWIVGIAAVISPMPFETSFNFDLMVMILASAVIILAVSVGKKFTLQRSSGFLFVGLYAIYIILSILRNKNPEIFL